MPCELSNKISNKTTVTTETNNANDSQIVTHHTVIKLVTRWSGSNRILFLDNLYTSPALCRHLLTIGIRSCGTFRTNRKHLPSGLKDAMKSLSEGETKAWQSGQLGCLVWCDKQPVLMLSTHHRVDDMSTIPQDRGPNHPTTVTKPQVALDYNVHKCHVDRVDQLRQYYAMQRKSRKNWPSLAWWLVDMCIINAIEKINAYTLWCLDTKAVINQLDFREALLQQIPAAYPPPHTRAQLAPSTPRITTADGHWPKHSAKKRDCRHCSRGRSGRVVSNFVCEQCNVHLCVDPCSKLYHQAL
jgi:transposase IS4-like protein/DDE family transposase